MQIFEKVTKHILQLATVLVHQVIQIIDRLTTELALAVADKDVHMSIRHGAQNPTRVVNKYYALSDDSVMYQVAMSEPCFIFPPPWAIDDCSQSYTQDTSSNTSTQKIGPWSGSTIPSHS